MTIQRDLPMIGHAHFLVLTALDVETEALKQHLNDVAWIEGTPYTFGTIAQKKGKGKYVVIFAQCDDTGTNPISSLVKKAIDSYMPHYILLIGIAAGFPESGVMLGDVLVAESISAYDKAKVKPDGIEHRGNPIQITATVLLGMARMIAGCEEKPWYSEMKQPRPNNDQRAYPMVHAQPGGVLGSGPKVVASLLAHERQWLIDTYKQNALGLECEALDTALACRASEAKFLIVKAAQDDATDQKDAKGLKDVWRPYAADAAATFAVRLMQSVLLKSIGSKPLGADEKTLAVKQLPFVLPQLDVPSFTGRDEKLHQLESILLHPGNQKICGISGIFGVGKSALACHFAQLYQDSFPNGVIGLRVEGKDINTIAREFAYCYGEKIDPEDERDATTIMQEIFGHRRVLLIFDNAEDASELPPEMVPLTELELRAF